MWGRPLSCYDAYAPPQGGAGCLRERFSTGMETYIATFYSHFGAMRFQRFCAGLGLKARTMPVPRNLSSSCGTCTRFECETLPSYEEHKDELEAIVRVVDGGYEPVYSIEGEEQHGR